MELLIVALVSLSCGLVSGFIMGTLCYRAARSGYTGVTGQGKIVPPRGGSGTAPARPVPPAPVPGKPYRA